MGETQSEWRPGKRLRLELTQGQSCGSTFPLILRGHSQQVSTMQLTSTANSYMEPLQGLIKSHKAPSRQGSCFLTPPPLGSPSQYGERRHTAGLVSLNRKLLGLWESKQIKLLKPLPSKVPPGSPCACACTKIWTHMQIWTCMQ